VKRESGSFRLKQEKILSGNDSPYVLTTVRNPIHFKEKSMTTEAPINTTVDSGKFVERLIHRVSNDQPKRPVDGAAARSGQTIGSASSERGGERGPAYFPYVSIYS